MVFILLAALLLYKLRRPRYLFVWWEAGEEADAGPCPNTPYGENSKARSLLPVDDDEPSLSLRSLQEVAAPPFPHAHACTHVCTHTLSHAHTYAHAHTITITLWQDEGAHPPKHTHTHLTGCYCY